MRCFYHNPCTDGLVSAWIVNKYAALNKIDAIFVPSVYQKTVPEVEPGEKVLVVDFSFSPEHLVEMCKVAETVIVIDHHDSAIKAIWEYFDKNPIPNNLDLRLNEELSGAGGTWKFLFPRSEVPKLVAAAQDYDLWKFDLDYSRAVVATIKTFPDDLQESFGLLNQMEVNIDAAIRQSAPLIEKEDAMVAMHVKDTVMVEFEGYLVPMCNVPKYIHSLVGNELSKNYPFCITYYDNGKEREYSLRSSQEHGVVINGFAEKRGGGGHPHSAGFKVPLVPHGIFDPK
jgi:nanoRNase/pAp phosphatase (c-di-AMP/oligoRNAs hydrolase)